MVRLTEAGSLFCCCYTQTVEEDEALKFQTGGVAETLGWRQTTGVFSFFFFRDDCNAPADLQRASTHNWDGWDESKTSSEKICINPWGLFYIKL